MQALAWIPYHVDLVLDSASLRRLQPTFAGSQLALIGLIVIGFVAALIVLVPIVVQVFVNRSRR
jgi:hypothetical protein